MEGLVGEMMGFERFPVALDVVEFGRIFWQPFGREPVRALGQRGARGLAGVNRARGLAPRVSMRERRRPWEVPVRPRG
ncbi:MAG TPA: hypothetical protein VHE60_00130 [Pyrinomonadaceae bacterium]|nr:hypothetical protein [Pyrinomonadaceae bacterium]